MGRADVQVLELIEGRTAVFKSAGQFAALDPMLAGVLIESAFRDSQIFGSLSVLEPRVYRISLERKTWRGLRYLWDLLSDSSQCSS